MSIYRKCGNFHAKKFCGLKIFNLILKFEGNDFVAKTVVIIEKLCTRDNPMVMAALLCISHWIPTEGERSSCVRETTNQFALFAV